MLFLIQPSAASTLPGGATGVGLAGLAKNRPQPPPSAGGNSRKVDKVEEPGMRFVKIDGIQGAKRFLFYVTSRAEV